jgi:hypothetical protein
MDITFEADNQDEAQMWLDHNLRLMSPTFEFYTSEIKESN